MTKPQTLTVDGNQAAAEIAHMTNEVIAIYPITPASPMGEWADEWSARERPNLWGTVPHVVEMQSEGGAAGRPWRPANRRPDDDLYRITGFVADDPQYVQDCRRTLTHRVPCRRPLAGRQALSIFGDHSDVMASPHHRLWLSMLQLARRR